eukprot:1334323-Prymnesium_polylepis.1
MGAAGVCACARAVLVCDAGRACSLTVTWVGDAALRGRCDEQPLPPLCSVEAPSHRIARMRRFANVTSSSPPNRHAGRHGAPSGQTSRHVSPGRW